MRLLYGSHPKIEGKKCILPVRWFPDALDCRPASLPVALFICVYTDTDKSNMQYRHFFAIQKFISPLFTYVRLEKKFLKYNWIVAANFEIYCNHFHSNYFLYNLFNIPDNFFFAFKYHQPFNVLLEWMHHDEPIRY